MLKRPTGLKALQLPIVQETQSDYGLTDTEASSRGSPETVSSTGSPETTSTRSSPETIGPDSPEYSSPLKKRRPEPLQILPRSMFLSTPPMSVPDQFAPLLRPNNITDIENVQEGNFGDMVAVKTKPQFVARKNSTKSLGIKLYFFENKAENTFTKTFVYNIYDDPQAVLIKILSEVYYHKKANNLQGTCKFKAPKLIAYGYVEDLGNKNVDLTNSYMFYIKMERIDELQVSKLTGDDAYAKCNAARTKLVAINECLENNNLHHNDLHADNVMLNKQGEIVIIDFGEATDKLTKFINFDKFCSKFEPKKNGGRKSRKQLKVIKRGATKRRPAKKMRRTIKKHRSSRRARK